MDISNVKSTTSTPVIASNYRSVVDTTPTNTTQATHDISFNSDANVFVLKWTDKESKVVIEQIPAEVMIEFAKYINKMLGNIIDTKA